MFCRVGSRILYTTQRHVSVWSMYGRVAEGKHDVNDLHSIYGPHINTLRPVTTIRDADMTLEELGSDKDDGGGSGDARR